MSTPRLLTSDNMAEKCDFITINENDFLRSNTIIASSAAFSKTTSASSEYFHLSQLQLVLNIFTYLAR